MPSIYQTKDPGFILEQATVRKSSRERELMPKSRSESEQSQSQRSGGWLDARTREQEIELEGMISFE